VVGILQILTPSPPGRKLYPPACKLYGLEAGPEAWPWTIFLFLRWLLNWEKKFRKNWRFWTSSEMSIKIGRSFSWKERHFRMLGRFLKIFSTCSINLWNRSKAKGIRENKAFATAIEILSATLKKRKIPDSLSFLKGGWSRKGNTSWVKWYMENEAESCKIKLCIVKIFLYWAHENERLGWPWIRYRQASYLVTTLFCFKERGERSER